MSTLPTFSNERNPQLQIIQHYNQIDQINNVIIAFAKIKIINLCHLKINRNKNSNFSSTVQPSSFHTKASCCWDIGARALCRK
jgi:hypothetical protein